MYSFLVSGNDEAWRGELFELDLARYLEYTSPEVIEQFIELSASTIERLRATPALFAHERGAGEVAWVGRITEIRLRHQRLRLRYAFDERIQPIHYADLLKAEWELDIDSSELTRTHWAIKDADLYTVLADAGLADGSLNPQGGARVTRADILKAAKQLERLGHTDFDRLLLEWGVDGLNAGRAVGGLMARANSVAEFALTHAEAHTADGQPLAEALLDAAARSNPEPEPALNNSIGGSTADISTPALPSREGSQTMVPARPKIFLVHGRDHAPLHQIARFLDRLKLEPVILHEQPNGGRTLIAKFQEVAAGANYAVVLMTPDDQGGLSGAAGSQPRARQNVVFELGFFIGKLGADRVCALVAPGVERPSDFEAVVYVPLDLGGNWQLQLARELRHAGLPVHADALL